MKVGSGVSDGNGLDHIRAGRAPAVATLESPAGCGGRWSGAPRLGREPGDAVAHLAHDRLEVGIGVVPEAHEPAVPLDRRRAVAPLLVEVAEAAEDQRVEGRILVGIELGTISPEPVV